MPFVRTAIIFLALLILFIIIQVPINKYLYNRGKEYNGSLVLHDVMHQLIPEIESLQLVADVICIVSVVSFILYFAYQRRPQYVIVYGIFMLLLQFLCIIYFAATVLPDSKNGNCKCSDKPGDSILNMGSCNALNISVHLLTIGLAHYIWSRYQDHAYWPAHLLVYIASFVVIAGSRNHYTIDCVNSTVLLMLIISQKDNILQIIMAVTKENIHL